MLITGTSTADTLLGLAGDDTIFGWKGNDRILDSSGNNIVNGNEGDDSIYGGQGNDLLRGGTGKDILYGDQGDNTVFGDRGNDLIFVGEGNNIVNGNEGDDTIYGGQGNDLLRGGKGNDSIFGNAGDDTIYGDWGADTIAGMGGKDIFVIGRINSAIAKTTGGPNRKDADVITDFESGVDLISVTGGLSYADLDIQQGTEIDANNTIIKDKVTGEYLVILLNNRSSRIDESILITEKAPISIFRDDRSYGDNGGNPTDRNAANINAIDLNQLVKLPTAITTLEDTDFVFSNQNTISLPDSNLFNYPIKLTLVVNNGTLILNSTNDLTFHSGNNGSANMTFTGNITSINAAINKLTFTPNRNFSGNASISVLAEIESLIGFAGNKINSTIPVTVTPVNDAPVNTVPGNQIINQNETIVFSGDKNISIADIDAGDNPVQVNLETNHGTLNLNTTDGVVFRSGNNGDRQLTFRGKIGNINSALNNLTFLPDRDFTGDTSIAIITDDLGNTGGENLSDRDTINIKITTNDLGNTGVGGAQIATNTSISVPVNPYTVSITTPNNTIIAEEGSSKYRLSRDGTVGDLPLNLTIDSSSTVTSFPGGAFPVDYTLSGGSVTIESSHQITVTIPDGESFVDVTLTANKDDHAEAWETLKLNLANPGKYNIDATKNNATLTIIGGGTVVTSTKDDGSWSNYALAEGSLRQAIANATLNWQAEDTITFNLPETSPKITLTAKLDIEDPLIIDSPANKVTIDGDNQYQIFNVYKTNATFNNLLLVNGKGNSNYAGGIHIQESEVTISNSIFSKNTSTGKGGAIHSSKNSNLKVIDSSLDNNISSAIFGGGGIANNGTAIITNSTISNNSAFAFLGGGGGIANNGTIAIDNSTIVNNFTDASGGGIVNSGTITIKNSTIAKNSAGDSGGAIYNAGKVIASNTIIADNKSDSRPDFDGTLTSSGYNLIGNTAGITIVGDTTGNILNQSAKLDSLKDNGGLTQTMALLAGSPGINAGDPHFIDSDLLYDQRGVGFDRIFQNRIDIGAFESNF